MKITKFFISLITCLTFLGCEENPQIQPSKERLKDIHEVIKAIIIQDSIFDNIYLRNPIWFCIDLKVIVQCRMAHCTKQIQLRHLP
jgi:hypothetical protein